MTYHFKFARSRALLIVLASAMLLLVSCENRQSKASKHGGVSSAHGASTGTPSQPTPPTSTTPPPTKSAPTDSRINPNRQALPNSAYDWIKDTNSPYSGEFNRRCVYPEKAVTYKYNMAYGSVLDELFYVRSRIRKYYIFNDEVVDLDPRLHSHLSSDFDEHFEKMTDKDSYLQKLRSTKKLEDGTPRHGLFQANKEQPQPGLQYRFPYWRYGILWDKRSEVPPRNYVAKVVLPNSPGAELANGSPKVKRGDRLTKINDVDFISSDGDDINQKFYKWLNPEKSGEVTKFEFIDRDTQKAKTVWLSSKFYGGSNDDHFQFTKLIETNNGSVGYINIGASLNSFYQIYETIKEFKKNEVKDVIVDIRYYKKEENPQDTHRSEPMLLYSILGKENTAGKQYRNRISRKGAEAQWRDANQSIPFYSKCKAETSRARDEKRCNQSSDRVNGYACGFLWLYRCGTATYDFDLESLNLNKVYLLTSNETCHIGELIINGLRGIDVEVIQIGEQTCGSSYLAYKDSSHNCGIEYEIYDTKFTNNKNEGDYPYGFQPKNTKSDLGIELPGCFVQDDLSKDLGDTEEVLLAAALQYRKDGTCPKVP